MYKISHNWSEHVAFGAAAVHFPTSIAEVQQIVRGADKVRVVGTRHSFNAIADTVGALISLRALPRRAEIDPVARTVTIDGGITYAELAVVIDAAGFALFNLPSVPDFTVVGAVSTATHGSGNANRNLAASVAGLQIVTASGELLQLRRGDADFEGAVVGLGALGVVVAMTLDLVPRFDIRQTVYRNLPFDTVVENFDAIMGSAYSVSLFTHWNSDAVDQCWLKELSTSPAPRAEFFGGKAAVTEVSPVVGKAADGTTGQLGTVGKWYEMLPHFRIGVIPFDGYEYQSEYFIARRHAPAAMQALKAVQAGLHPALVVSEIRTIAEDRLWLSTNTGADSVGFHFSMTRDWAVVQQALAVIESALAPFNPRPHWGKLFVMPAAAVRASHPRLGDFVALAMRLDPAGKFRNAFVDAFVFGR